MSQMSCTAKEISKFLIKYCIKVCNINGLDTYIISSKYYDDILADTELLNKLSISIFASVDLIKCFISIVNYCWRLFTIKIILINLHGCR